MLVVEAATLPPLRVLSGDDWCPDSPQISPYQAKFYIQPYIVNCGSYLVVLITKKKWEKWEFFFWLEVEERFRAEGDIQEQRR